jgi:Flp pilus assembly protein TadG
MQSIRSQQLRRNLSNRRGVTTVLAAILMVTMLGFVAFGVDVGYMLLVKTQLQVAADSAAMAAAANMSGTQSAMDTVAQQYAAYHQAGGKTVTLQTSDIQYGLWDSTARTFTSSSQAGNAIRVTARRDSSTGGNNTFFGRIFGINSFNVSASAVALGNPRDICFVVDLSGSMNRDTWTGYGSSPAYRSSSYSTGVYTSMMQQIFSDFNFGSYPGSSQTVGQNVGATSWSNLCSSSGPLSHSSITILGITITIPSTYKIVSGDNSSARTLKAYKWVIDKQIATLMPNAKPAANSGNSSSLNYWQAYIDDVNSNSGVIGPRSYVSWCLDSGRDQQADTNGDYAQISVNSPNCPYHSESTAGGTFSFPPREYPTHAERRSVIAGLQEVKSKNTAIKDTNQMDWVSIVTFDKVGDMKTLLPLTSDYDSAMQASTKMQAVGYNGASTDTESGLIQGYNLIKAKSQGGTGRENTQKIVILLTDGVANLKDTSSSTISSYEVSNPTTYNGSSNYYGSSDYNSDAAFMQANIMRAQKWYVYALGLGCDIDDDFLDRMARVGGTADDNGHGLTTSGDPTTYETEMTSLLKQVVDNPSVRLVQ